MTIVVRNKRGTNYMAKVMTIYPSVCKLTPNSTQYHMFLEILCSSIRDTGKCESLCSLHVEVNGAETENTVF